MRLTHLRPLPFRFLRTRAPLAAAASLVLAAAAMAQRPVRPVPLVPVPAPAGVAAEEVVLAPDLDAIAALTALDEVVLEGLVVPGGGALDLALRRLDPARLGFGFRVDGARRPDLLDGLDLSIWRGAVVGQPETSVVLAFSRVGSRGWIEGGGEVLHLVGRPDASGDWTRGDVLVVAESTLAARGSARPSFCPTALAVPGVEPAPGRVPQAPHLPVGGACALKECRIAFETDYQLLGVFGSLPAMTAYMTTLLTAISDRYEEQIGTVLTYPYLQFWTSPSDPWATPDDPGGSTGELLDEFRAAWLGAIPEGADLAHFVSGASLGGGIAYLDVLCIPDFAFGVSANIGGDVSFPIQQQSGNWDFMVIAHELGHNFSAPHTHDFDPPIDQCAFEVCITDGTIMSYCHLCDGGTANITTYFHAQNVALMTSAAQSCLDDFSGSILGEELELVSDVAPTPVTATVFGTPVGAVELRWRYDGGVYQSTPMTGLGGGLYTADLPPADCADAPEYWYAFTDVDCGPVTDPPGAPAVVHAAQVGSSTTVFADTFDAPGGWSATNLGASSGDWQRGVPVDDGGWPYDPSAGYDGGAAFLTQNEFGNTDVDDGAVRLESPVLDLSAAGSGLRYAFFLRLTEPDGADALVVEMDDGSGTWVEIARHDADGGLAWHVHAIDAAALAGAGLAPTAATRVRFTANDGDPQSIVEAGIDAFEVTVLECAGGEPGPGVASCFGVSCPCGNDDATAGCANSTGSGALLSGAGSTSTAADDLVLTATNVPNDQQGLCYMGDALVQAPFFDGFQCALGTTFRFLDSIQSSGTTGTMTYTGVVAGSAVVTPGSTWHFHFWHRDFPLSPCGTGANLTNVYSVTFTP